MDFEWQTRAPGDVTSPFYQLSMQHENQKKRMAPFTTILILLYCSIFKI